MKEMDVVYTYKYSYSREIEYSIKSLRNIDHRKVYVIGDNPNVKGIYLMKHIPHKWANLPSLNVASKLIDIVNNENISEDFILMMDDVFIMKKIRLTNYYRGNLADHLNKRRYNDRYKRLLQNTYDYLDRCGYTKLDFACHTPFIMNKTKLKELLEEIMPLLEYKKELSIRTLYGNKYKVKASYIRQDPKNPQRYYNFPILSTTEVSFNQHGIGKYIRGRLSD